MIDLEEGKRLLAAAASCKQHDCANWDDWASDNGQALIEEIERLRGVEPKMFNHQTRLQILCILAKEALEEKTTEAELRFEKALLQHLACSRD